MELGYDVFLVPAQPFVEPEAPRPGDPPSWSPPVDALLTADQAERLGEWIAASGKRLTAIYLTHGHASSASPSCCADFRKPERLRPAARSTSCGERHRPRASAAP